MLLIGARPSAFHASSASKRTFAGPEGRAWVEWLLTGTQSVSRAVLRTRRVCSKRLSAR